MENAKNQRSQLVKAITQRESKLTSMSHPGYRSIIFHRSNSKVMIKLIKDDDQGEDVEEALALVAKHIRKETKQMKVDTEYYKTDVKLEDAEEFCSRTFQDLLLKLGISDQCPPSLLMANMLSSLLIKKTTPLQLSFSNFFRSKKWR